MSQPITIERQGQRCYALGNTYPIRDALKGLGAHWDGERRAWWIGAAKEAALRALLAEAAPVASRDPVERAVAADRAEEAGKDALAAELRAAPPAEDVSGKRVYAQVAYRGRRYYVIAEAVPDAEGRPTRCRLATLDQGGPVFWADCSACELIRRYEGREVWAGRRYSGRTETVYPTVGSLRRFRDRQRDPATARHQCPECGSWCDAGEECRDCGGGC